MQISFKRRLNEFKRIRVPLVLLLLILPSIFINGCSKPQIKMPTVSQTATDQHHTGKFVWFDLYTDDMTGTRIFYENLFGWSFQTTLPGNQNVKTILREGIPIATAIYSKPLKKNIKESRWLGYISVEDVDMISGVIEQNNGTIYIQPKHLPDRGRVAVAIDPEGAIFAIIEATGGDPSDVDFLENQWMGSELWTKNMESAIAFYNLVAGYEPRRISMEADTDYVFLVRDNKARAGVVSIEWEQIKPDWLPYIAVADVVVVADKAAQFGGRVLVQPDTSVLDGRVAIISDPSGAVFAVQQLSDKDSGGEQ